MTTTATKMMDTAAGVEVIEEAPAPKPKPGRKPKKQRAPRVVKPKKWIVQRFHRILTPDGKPVEAWVDQATGDEIHDTRSGEQWVKANGEKETVYRVFPLCSEKMRRVKEEAVLE